MKGIEVYHYVYRTITILLEYINRLPQFSKMFDIALNAYFTLPYYVGIMLNAFNDLLCSKLYNYAGIIGRSLNICIFVLGVQLFSKIKLVSDQPGKKSNPDVQNFLIGEFDKVQECIQLYTPS